MLGYDHLFAYHLPFPSDVDDHFDNKVFKVPETLAIFVTRMLLHSKSPHRVLYSQALKTTQSLPESIGRRALKDYHYYLAFPQQFHNDPTYIIGQVIARMSRTFLSIASCRGIEPDTYVRSNLRWINAVAYDLIEILSTTDLIVWGSDYVPRKHVYQCRRNLNWFASHDQFTYADIALWEDEPQQIEDIDYPCSLTASSNLPDTLPSSINRDREALNYYLSIED